MVWVDKNANKFKKEEGDRQFGGAFSRQPATRHALGFSGAFAGTAYAARSRVSSLQRMLMVAAAVRRARPMEQAPARRSDPCTQNKTEVRTLREKLQLPCA